MASAPRAQSMSLQLVPRHGRLWCGGSGATTLPGYCPSATICERAQRSRQWRPPTQRAMTRVRSHRGRFEIEIMESEIGQLVLNNKADLSCDYKQPLDVNCPMANNPSASAYKAEFVRRTREAREARGYTQEAIAKLPGHGPRYLQAVRGPVVSTAPLGPEILPGLRHRGFMVVHDRRQRPGTCSQAGKAPEGGEGADQAHSRIDGSRKVTGGAFQERTARGPIRDFPALGLAQRRICLGHMVLDGKDNLSYFGSPRDRRWPR